MSKDPAHCCIRKANGERCANKPMYKIGPNGFCEEHKRFAFEKAAKTAGSQRLTPTPAFQYIGMYQNPIDGA